MARDRPPLEGLDLNLLVTLRVLLRESNVTRSAERLGQTQPTVSRALNTLRKTFGDPLLVRSGRGMVLTPVAEGLRHPLERALAALDGLGTAGAFDPAHNAKTFRLMMPDIVGTVVLPPVLERLQHEAPAVSLEIFGSLRGEERALLDEEVDLVIAAPRHDHPELQTRTVASVPWGLVYGRCHPRWPKPLDEAAWLTSDQVQLIPEGRPDLPGSVQRHLDETGRERRIRIRMSYIAGLEEVLRRWPVVATLPMPLAQRLARDPDIACFPHPLGTAIPPTKLRMTWHRSRQDDAGHGWLRSMLAEEVGRALDGPPLPSG